MTIRKKSKALLNITAEIIAAKMRYWRYVRKYGDSAPKPYEIIWVDPSTINYCTLPSLMGQMEISRFGSHIVGGDWDRRTEYDGVWYTRSFSPPVVAKLENHALYRSMIDHFENNLAWRETEWYRWVENNPNIVGQYQNVDMMEERLAKVDELFDYIQSNGYKTQRELEQDGDPPLHEKSFPCPEHHEVDVNIGRSGKLFFNFGGRHRLSIAKILRLDQIPVRVLARHQEWQNYRSEIVNKSKEVQHNHPDIENLLSFQNQPQKNLHKQSD